MDFCAETNEVSKRKTACREALEQPIECDITLPEYLPDIQRVLKDESAKKSQTQNSRTRGGKRN